MSDLKKRGFYKGVNLGGWFSQCDYSRERLSGFITDADLAQIAAWGVDHVRIPVDYNILEDAYGREQLDRAVNMCRVHGLHLVLDLHKTRGFSFDTYSEQEAGFFESPVYQEQFYKLWEYLAQQYGSQPTQIAFELLNEVTNRAYLAPWKEISRTCIRRIRHFAPDTLLLVGSYENNSALTVHELDAPYDENVIYNMHCYEPLHFTHQGAYWTTAIDPDKRYPFADSDITPAYFEELFASAIQKAETHHTSLYCGEYGIIDRVSPEDTLAWYRTIHTIFEKYSIARCAWTYRALDFGLCDERLDGVRKELIKNL